MSVENKFQFNFGSEPKPIVTKTGEGRGNIAQWFGRGDVLEGDITKFEYDGSKSSLPTKMFNNNFSQLEETEEVSITEE